jgi:hypothetical protein
MLSGKDWRISIIRHITSLILNELDWTLGMATHEGQEINCRMADSGWIKIPLDKSMTK